jgi:hypothetical protein
MLERRLRLGAHHRGIIAEIRESLSSLNESLQPLQIHIGDARRSLDFWVQDQANRSPVTDPYRRRDACVESLLSLIESLDSPQIHIGDATRSLDFWVQDQANRSAVPAFQLNGGYIRRYSAAPTLDADLHLNPPYGVLLGEHNSTMYYGEVR